MAIDSIKRVGVVGCGLMGGGIVQVCAQSGYSVLVTEINDEFLQKGLERVRGALEGLVKKGKITEEQKGETLERIKGTLSLGDFAECDLIIEAVIEDIEEKRRIFGALEEICPPGTIFTSNTSSIPIIRMAMTTKRPDRFCGLHFFNPVPIMKLVEVVRALTSSDETIQTMKEFASSLGKTPVETKDRAGFIVNLLLIPYLCEAIRALEVGLATKEDIDTAMTLGCSHPMGPLALADFIGLDTVYSIATILHDEFKEPKYAPPTLLKQMVTAGYLGRKSGRGFYTYQ